MDALLEAFIMESRENLETAGRCFLELEEAPENTEILNDLFRAIHTIKGSSGLFEITALTTVVHASEDVLDVVRSGELKLTSAHVDLFLETMDQVRAWLDNMESAGTLSHSAEKISKTLTKSLRALLNNPGPEESKKKQDEAAAEEITAAQGDSFELSESIEWLKNMPDNDRMELFKSAGKTQSTILAIEYIPDSKCFFAGDDPLHTIRSLPGIAWFHIQQREQWPDSDQLDPYNCNMVFYAVASGDEDAIRHYMRYVTEETIFTPFSLLRLVIPTGKVTDSGALKKFVDKAREALALQDWKKLRKLITPLLKKSESETLHTSALRWLDIIAKEKSPEPVIASALLDTIIKGEFSYSDLYVKATSLNKNEEVSDQSVAATPTTMDENQLKAANNILATQRQILSMTCEQEMLSGRISSVSTVLTNLFQATQIPNDDLREAITSSQKKESAEDLIDFLSHFKLNTGDANNKDSEASLAVSSKLSSKNKNSLERRITERRSDDRRQGNSVAPAKTTIVQNKILKIDQQRVDALMDLVGELVVAKNALPFLAKRAEEDFGIRPLAKEIKAQYAIINRLSEELQGAMMQIRMVPVSNIFQRFPRLVRDLSRKLDKNIRLVLEGEETEADKNIVDNLADPLIHLVRNSLDHGLEGAEDREASGKCSEGTITLRAIPHDDQVVIEVADDGRGIDPEIIKRKAYEKGIIDEHRLDTISNNEALQLILTAGFSTAEEVSDLSGRGVGMDVVRTAVNEVGGSVMVSSEKGRGSTVRLSLPLSMAVSRVMMIEVASQNYGISMEHIIETVRVPGDSIHKIKQNDAMVIRDRLIPIFHLRTLLNLPTATDPPEEAAVLVMAFGGVELGIIIDEFHEGIDIMQKPLEGIMAENPYYSGSALLGDGSVLLVLNIKELVSWR